MPQLSMPRLLLALVVSAIVACIIVFISPSWVNLGLLGMLVVFAIAFYYVTGLFANFRKVYLEDNSSAHATIDVRILRVQDFTNRYTNEFLNHVKAVDWLRESLLGKVSNRFSIIEFEIQNEFQTPVTVFRLEVDDWIYSKSYVRRSLYGSIRDYRVYDLYTREQVNLDAHISLPPHGILGRRLEIFEGSYWRDNHGQRFLPERKEFILRVNTIKGLRAKTIPVTNAAPISELERVSLWSHSELVDRPDETIYDGGFRP